MKICYISLLVSNSKSFHNIIYFEFLEDYSQAKQLQTKVSGQYAEEILLNISKSLFNIYLYMYSKSCIHIGKHNINSVNMPTWHKTLHVSEFLHLNNHNKAGVKLCSCQISKYYDVTTKP